MDWTPTANPKKLISKMSVIRKIYIKRPHQELPAKDLSGQDVDSNSFFLQQKMYNSSSSLTEPWQGCKTRHTEDSPAASALSPTDLQDRSERHLFRGSIFMTRACFAILSIFANKPIAKWTTSSLTELLARFGYIGLPQETPKERNFLSRFFLYMRYVQKY